jgi:hypothetical protein
MTDDRLRCTHRMAKEGRVFPSAKMSHPSLVIGS